MKDIKSKITFSNFFLAVMGLCCIVSYILAAFTNAIDLAAGTACAALIACVMASATRKD